MTEDEMVGWHQRLNGHEFEETLGDDDGQGSLVCCSLLCHRVEHDLASEQHVKTYAHFQTAMWNCVMQT